MPIALGLGLRLGVLSAVIAAARAATLLLEDGSAFLLEDGSFLLLEA